MHRIRLGHRILRVAAADLIGDSPADVWNTDPQFALPEGQFGLNGLATIGQDLYIVSYQGPDMYRVRIENDGSAGATEVVELGRVLSGADGLKRLGRDSLLVVEGNSNSISRIDLDDSGATVVTPIIGRLDVPTTFALHGSRLWVVEGQLDHFFGIDPEPPAPFRAVHIALY